MLQRQPPYYHTWQPEARHLALVPELEKNSENSISTLGKIAEVLASDSKPFNFMFNHFQDRDSTFMMTLGEKSRNSRIVFHSPTIDHESGNGFYDTLVITQQGELALSLAGSEKLPNRSKRYDYDLSLIRHFKDAPWEEIPASELPEEYAENIQEFLDEPTRYRGRDLTTQEYVEKLLADDLSRLTRQA